jgi:hypothetical protein
MGIYIGFWWKIQKEEEYHEDLDLSSRIILK